MNKLLLFTILNVSTLGFAQTQFWSDTFETNTSNTSGNKNTYKSGNTPNGSQDNPIICPIATPDNTGSYFFSLLSTSRYFNITNGSNISVAAAYANFQGTNFLAGEDIDDGSTIGEYRSIVWSNINIANKTNITFKGLFAANNSNAWDFYSGFAPLDYITVFYKIDNGSWINGLAFFPSTNNAATALSRVNNYPTNYDNNALGNGIDILNNAFKEFTYNVTGTGSSLSIRFDVHSNSSNEEFAVDNFRLFETISLGTGDFNFNSKLSITPNPSNAIFNININTNATIEVYDLIGKQIISKKIDIGVSQLDMSNYKTGIYLLKVTNAENQSKTMKIVKQ